MLPEEKILTYQEFAEMNKNNSINLEFIDGEVLLLAAPSVIHQQIVTNLSTEFGIYFRGKEFRHFVSPFDVVLLDEETTHNVQPDLTVICDKSGLGEQNYKGIPTLVVEVLSPSTASIDFIKKMRIYMEAGIKEYWIISPKNKTVEVFFLKEDNKYSEPTIYFGDTIVKSKTFKDLEIDIKNIFN